MLTLETRTPLPLTYEATGTPPAIALFDEGATEGAPIESSGAPNEAGVPRSRPSACCALSWPVIAEASWPSRPRASPRSWFWKRSRPATEPPAMKPSGKARVTPPSLMPICSLEGSNASATVTSGVAWPPSTSF